MLPEERKALAEKQQAESEELKSLRAQVGEFGKLEYRYWLSVSVSLDRIAQALEKIVKEK